MAKVSVTYNMPDGDNPVVITGGKRFFDGQALELDSEEHAMLIERLCTNQHFSVEDSAPVAPKQGSW